MGMGAVAAASHYAEERRRVCRPAYTHNPIANMQPDPSPIESGIAADPGEGPVSLPKPPWRALS